MNKIIRFYNQNREKIIKIVLIIVFVMFIIQLLNHIVKVRNKNTSYDNVIQNNLKRTNTAEDALISNKSIISDTKISEDALKVDINVIEQFINYCNNKDINNAYNILSNECKEVLYPTIEDFYKTYYSIVFNDKFKNYTMENWEGSTYLIMITDDILSTGKVNNSNTRQDYMTIVIQDGENKLNINNYIGRKNINKKTMRNDIEVVVLNKDIYLDYEIYNFKFTNNSNKKILLDNCQNSKSIYLLDNNEMKYYFYNNEIDMNKFIIENKFTNKLQIKFNKSYSSSKNAEKVVFSNVILNYEEYLKEENKQNYSDISELEVNI